MPLFINHAMSPLPTLRLFLLVFGLALSARAEIVLNLVLDDPKGLIKNQPGGMVKAGPEFAASTASVASGVGGRAIPQVVEGPAKERKADEWKIQVLAEPAMGTPAFLRGSLIANPVTRSVGAGIVPADVASSLSGLVTYQDGHAVINGAFDFFIRFNAEGMSQPRFGLWGKAGVLGFNFNVVSNERTAALKVFTRKKSLNFGGDKTGDKEGVEVRSDVEVFFDSDVIYHVAISFHTSEQGGITVTVSLQPGTGPMNAADATVAAIRNFWVVGEEDRAMPDKIALALGRSEQAQTMDLAAFRIFKPAPDIFPGIDGKP